MVMEQQQVQFQNMSQFPGKESPPFQDENNILDPSDGIKKEICDAPELIKPIPR